MAGPAGSDGKARVVRRRRAWWQWVLGIGLLGGAALLAVVNYRPGLWPGSGLATQAVEPRQIRISPQLELSEVVPAAPGALAGSNLLLVTFDTTRADRIGCYGHEAIHTPTLDRLARSGVLFSAALTVAPVTLPSHCSLMTGLYPFHHGTRANSSFRLDEGHRTLAEVLVEAGYVTGAMISAFVLDSRFGLAQGFRTYDDDVGEPGEEEDPEDYWRIAERGAGATTDAAEAWLRKHADEKFFLWVHYFDPHLPYEAPQPYADQYDVPYDAEIAFTDAQFGRLLAVLDEVGQTDETLVVVAGDHGEGLGQHGEPSHGFLLYDSTLHVPLIMRCGSKLAGGVHVNRLVSLVDVMPTVLSLLGIPAPEGLDGVDLTQPASGSRVVFFEALQGLMDQGWAALLGLREGSTKYIYGPEAELYELSGDPFEEGDLLGQRPQLASTLKQRLQDFYGDDLEKASAAEPTEQLDPEALAKLRGLGYLGGTGAPPPAPAQRPHPKEMMPLLSRLHAARMLESTAGRDEMIKALKAFVEDHPDFASGHHFLAVNLLDDGDFEGAEAQFARLLELRPTDPHPLLALGRVKMSQGRLREAAELYRQVLEKLPDHFSTLRQLGGILLRQGEYPEGVEVLARALHIRPRDRTLPDIWTDAMLTVNRQEEAVETLQNLLEADPNLPMVQNALARLLAGMQQYAEAIAVLRDGIEFAPDRHELVNNLAFILVSCPDAEIRSPVEAAVLMERVCDQTGYEHPMYMHTLSMVYAQLMRVDEAIALAQKARQIASTSNRPEFSLLAPGIGASLESYKQAKKAGLHPMLMARPPKEPEPAQEGPGPDAQEPVQEPDDG